MAVTGKPIDRVDGRLKVTGAAKYAAEFNQPNMAYAFPVCSTIAKGTITAIDTRAALSAAGVLTVLTHENAVKLKAINPAEQMKAGVQLVGEDLPPLQTNKIYYFKQCIACVVAETYEQARFAANLVKITYAQEKPASDLKSGLANGYVPEKNMGQPAQINSGKAAAPFAAAPVKFERTYTTPTETHHPMEPHAAVAMWDRAGKLTIYDSSQGVLNIKATAAYFLQIKPENVRVLSPFIGGAFGGKGLWMQPVLAAMAAQAVKRPVKVVLTRQMLVAQVGRRPETSQKIALGAGKDGKLSVIRHHTDTYNNNVCDYLEPCGSPTQSLYNAPLREITYKVAKLNLGSPTYMRAPGKTPGTFAFESAMDELAYELKLDPIELRILNHATNDPLTKTPFSSEYLRDCYRIGAEKFGWSNRKSQPRQTRNGKYLVGYGMAAATYPGVRNAASARVQMTTNGDVKVMSATHDLGTGTYTVMAQTAADALGVPLEKIKVEIGDTNLPDAPLSVGSMTVATVTPAVLAACETLRKDLMRLAMADGKSELNGRRAEEVAFADAKFFVRSDSGKSDSYADIMRRHGKTMMEACATTKPVSDPPSNAPCLVAQAAPEENKDDKKYSFHSFGAQFTEVWVDEDLGIAHVKRFTSVHDVGRIMNEKTSRSQIIGGVIMGIGAALMEITEHDKRWAYPVTRSFADYHVPANLDAPPIDVYFINKPDPHISSLGARGVGEIGIVGVGAAIANAIFNATGKRIRDLPITIDKLL